MATLKVNGNGRPSNVKHPSAPSLMMNAHFASVGEDASKEAYEHGIQVIDEDKDFKYAFCIFAVRLMLMVVRNTVRICQRISTSRKSSPLASTTTSYPSSARSPPVNLRSSTTCSGHSLV